MEEKLNLNELKAEIGTWPEYVTEDDKHITIIRLLGTHSNHIYLKKVEYHGPFTDFVKKVFEEIMLSDPDAGEHLQDKDGNPAYALDYDQRTDQQILIEELKKG